MGVETHSIDKYGTVLLAEDSLDDVLMVSFLFKKMGIKSSLHVVPNGTAVVRYLKGEDIYQNRQRFPIPRLILLDLKMPRMDGFQVLQWLRSEPDFRHLPVVVLTNSVFSPDITRAYQLGANSFLIKSQDLTESPATLKQVIDFWLGGYEDLPKAA